MVRGRGGLLIFQTLILRCVTTSEAEAGANSEGSLMYGELAPAGARCVGEALLLASKDGGKAVDVGMGAGKVALQWFLEYQNLSTVVGVEKVESRFRWVALTSHGFHGAVRVCCHACFWSFFVISFFSLSF